MQSHLLLDTLEVEIRQLHPVRVEAHRGPDGSAVGGGRLEGARVGLVVAADGDDSPDIVLGRAGKDAAQVLEGGVVEMAVTVDDHLSSTCLAAC